MGIVMAIGGVFLVGVAAIRVLFGPSPSPSALVLGGPMVVIIGALVMTAARDQDEAWAAWMLRIVGGVVMLIGAMLGVAGAIWPLVR